VTGSTASTERVRLGVCAKHRAISGTLSLTQQGLITQDGLPPPQRRWAIVTVALAIFLTVVDQTIVNVALPTIAADLNVDASSSVWIVNAYQVAIMLSLLPLSAVGEHLRLQTRSTWRAWRSSAIAFAWLRPRALPVCATSMRVVQGLGAAGVMSVNMALVRFIHPIHRLGHGIGINAVIIAVSAAAGPTIASSIWPLPLGHGCSRSKCRSPSSRLRSVSMRCPKRPAPRIHSTSSSAI